MRRIPPIVLALLLLSAALAHARVPVELDGAAHLRITDVPTGSFGGPAVAAAGDVNGDGLGDVVIGASGSGTDEAYFPRGEALVVFGRRYRATVDARRLGAGGLRIVGPRPRRARIEVEGGQTAVVPIGEALGTSVAPAGDVNGDGLADVLVGAPYGGRATRGRIPGRAYVVFGRRSGGTIDLSAEPSAAARLDAPATAALAGLHVASIGDVNGDGRADHALGALPLRRRDPSAFVVYGGALPPATDLGRLGPNGVVLTGTDGVPSLAGAGDQDGDGVGDLVVGDPDAGRDTGRARLATRLAGGGTRDLRRSPSIAGERGSRFGEAVAGGADVTGDGRPDVVVGAPGDENARRVRGVVRVVPGPWPVDTSFVLPLEAPAALDDVPNTRLGASVGLLPDITGDGRGEILAGAPHGSPGCRLAAGSGWVIDGRPDNDAFAPRGDVRSTRLIGRTFGGATGSVVAPAGDVDGDGRGDLVVDSEPGSGLGVDEVPERVVLVAPAPPSGPAPPQSIALPPEGADCFSVTVDRASARSLLRTGRLRVRITSYVPLGRRATLLYEMTPVTRAARRRFVGASFRVDPIRMRSPGQTAATIRLNRRTLSRLRRGDRMEIVLFGDTGTTGARFRVG